MLSYASIDRIEGNIAVCEVELVDIYETQNYDSVEKETEMIDIPLETINSLIGTVEEGDILIVEYDMDRVVWIYAKDNIEKIRREEIIKGLYQAI